MRKKELAQIVIERLKEEYPDTHCTLDYDDAWKLLVSVRLAAQCTDARVNVVVAKLFADYPSVEALAEATPEEIARMVEFTKQAGGIAYAEQRMQELRQQALSLLPYLQHPEVRQSLNDYIDFVVERKW